MSATSTTLLAATVRVELNRTKELLLRCDGSKGHKVAALLDAIEALTDAIERVVDCGPPSGSCGPLLEGLSRANDELIVVLEKLDAKEKRAVVYECQA